MAIDNLSENETDYADKASEIQNELEQIENEEELNQYLDSLGDEEKNIASSIIHSQTYTYSGPLPPPQILDQFNEVIPDGANRIMELTEAQVYSRIEKEKSESKAASIDSRLGVLFAGLIGIIGLLGGFFLIYNGKEISGIIFGGGTLATLVGTYLKGTSVYRDIKNKNDEED